jgi:hypothetical protein
MKIALDNQDVCLGTFKVARPMKDTGIVANIPKKLHYYLSGKQLPNTPTRLKR